MKLFSLFKKKKPQLSRRSWQLAFFHCFITIRPNYEQNIIDNAKNHVVVFFLINSILFLVIAFCHISSLIKKTLLKLQGPAIYCFFFFDRH